MDLLIAGKMIEEMLEDVYERAADLPEAQQNDALVEAARLLSEEGIELMNARTEEIESEKKRRADRALLTLQTARKTA